ncbi:MAG: hypothetical protein LBI35_04095 [Burkholderiales bacterium]|jgi:hypothetical protein|nr:hypothetical protein [Burkholderiales bacterium]
MRRSIDIDFDFQEEAGGRDSDRYSPTLQEYHRILWSKPLPSGNVFVLTKIAGNRLYHKSSLGEFFLSSDRATATFSKWKRKQIASIISQVPEVEIKRFQKLSDTIGGILIWPCKQVGRMPTINGERGFNKKIADRFDLTIECIKRYYSGGNSPLNEAFKRYADFFSLFGNFKGYVDFFLLQDIVSVDYATVKIATPFENFNTSPIPSNVEEYLFYKDNTIRFIKARNARIASTHSI